MADILKVTTPLVKNNQIQPNRPSTDPTVPFNIQDINRVIRSDQKSELLQQNNILNQENAPSILMNLLKDPSVTVSFLKNIFMLQEIIRLLPANNSTVTQEIHQLFDALLVSPDQIVAEMMSQENNSTAFKGELFNMLRQLVSTHPHPEMRQGVAALLKSLNGILTKREILDSIANHLDFLARSLESSKTLSGRLAALSASFRREDATDNFSTLKQELLATLGEVENSILFSPKLAKLVPIVVYNLSRYNDNPDYLQETLLNLFTLMDSAQQKEKLLGLVRELLSTGGQSKDRESSRVMDTLAQIIGRQTDDQELTLLNADKIEKIIHSLLSSPCNFTPLLHFVVPVRYLDIKSFAEIWIDPNSAEGGGAPEPGENNIHILTVFDVEGIGQFEAELMVRQQEVSLQLFCPPAYIEHFVGIKDNLVQLIAQCGYRSQSVNIDKLERPRSLMDVFKSLPHRRTGIDVKV